MKKIFLFALMLTLVYLNAGAQFRKKDLKSGISFSLYHREPMPQNFFGILTKQENSGINLAVSTGIFISDKLEVGIAANYGQGKSNSEIDSLTFRFDSNGYVLSLYMNQYFGTGRKIIFFLMYKAGYNFSSSKSRYVYVNPPSVYNSDLTTSGFGVSLSPGIACLPFKKLVISTTVGSIYFNKGITKDNLVSNQPTDTFSYGLNLNPGLISIGFHYLF